MARDRVDGDVDVYPDPKPTDIYSPPSRGIRSDPTPPDRIVPNPPSKAWMARLMKRLFEEEVMATRAHGQKEYAGDDDNAFGNFERIAEELGIHREKVLWTYAMKHKDGIASWMRGHRSQREDVTGRIKDLIVYLFLLWGMIEQDRVFTKDPHHDG